MPNRECLRRDAAIEWYARNRARSAHLFDLLSDRAYYERPISLRHPIVFYEGHLVAFSLNTLVKSALGRPGVDEALEQLFARGIDPEAPSARTIRWPERTVVREFVAAADRLVVAALATADLDVPGHPWLDRADAVFTILEHEAMHHETLRYMWHRLPFEHKRRPPDYVAVTTAPAVRADDIAIPAGSARLGAARGEIPFGWDNELGELRVDVGAFTIDRHDVTNAAFLEFVDAGGYDDPAWWEPADWAWIREDQISHPPFWERSGDRWMWRGMFESIPLPERWPVYASQAEAAAFARWRGRRLPTEAEFHRAAYGSGGPERPYPWGVDVPTSLHGVFDFASWDPHPVGTHPAGRSPFGVEDLVGNGWEWTSSRFAPFPGFTIRATYPGYSADFFDDAHYVLKGASSATACELIRPTFRNWYRKRYPFVYASFRTVREGA
jgi:ergothioneine biosynthesis protein EgtB